MALRRRRFLQQVGLLGGAIASQELGVGVLAHRYHRVLAQPSPRKLALLVGINQYPGLAYDGGTSPYPTLRGCVTDVELQRELLVHRYGFRPSDILTLTDQHATRQAIESALLNHLLNQVREGDSVVVHFSGYGTLLQGVDRTGGDGLQSGLVPVDGVVGGSGGSNDLPEETLWLVVQCLQAAAVRVAVILDTSWTPHKPELVGNLRVRSRPFVLRGNLNSAAFEFQETLRERLQAKDQNFPHPPISPNSAALVFVAASWPHRAIAQFSGEGAGGCSRDGLAFEGSGAGFSAGVFTHRLTQLLWQVRTPASISVSFGLIKTTVKQRVGFGQSPCLLSILPSSASALGSEAVESLLFQPGIAPEDNPSNFPYPGLPLSQRVGEGVILAVDNTGDSGEVWLGGIPFPVLEYYAPNGVLEALPIDDSRAEFSGDSLSRLVVESRDGLKVKVHRGGSSRGLQVSQIVQERIRVLPRQVPLRIAMGVGLERIERVDAISAFSSFPWVVLGNAGEQPADYLLDRVQTEGLSFVQNSYGLFSLGQTAIPNTLGGGGEAVKTAVRRLEFSLQALLALKWLRLTQNEGSSRLKVRAYLEMTTPGGSVLMVRECLRGFSPPEIPLADGMLADAQKIPVGSRVRYRLENWGDRPVYGILFGIDSSGSPIALYTVEGENRFVTLQWGPGETLTIPRSPTDFEWVVQGPPGLAQIYLVCSTSPFRHTLEKLQTFTGTMGNGQRIAVPGNPLAIAEAVLLDLHEGSAEAVHNLGIGTGDYALDVMSWTTLNFTYQVV